MRRFHRVLASIAGLGSALLLAPAGAGQERIADASPWALPDPGSCADRGSATPDGQPPSSALLEGAVITFDRLGVLEDYLPPEVWEWRDRLFHEGMRLEVGPCFRRYAPPEFFRAATLEHSGRAKLLAGGGLVEATAGLPFDPEAIEAEDAQAGQNWAWNVARRWRGAGRFGDVRVTYSDAGGTSTHLVGDHFVALLMGRADLRETGYQLSWAKKDRWVAGGKARDPSTGGRCAFRHYRGVEFDESRDTRDDVFFSSSQMRKPERVGWDPEFPLLACAYERGFYLPRGGAVQRYRWRVAGVRDLLAPINAKNPVYPINANRDFGKWGASFATDRWELRRVLVLEATPPGWTIRRYVDLETLFPLYHAEDLNGAQTIIQYLGRWSEDRDEYPRLPSAPDQPVRVIDPVAQVNVRAGEVLRIEAWQTVAVPNKPGSLRRLVSMTSLAKSR